MGYRTTINDDVDNVFSDTVDQPVEVQRKNEQELLDEYEVQLVTFSSRSMLSFFELVSNASLRSQDFWH
jgi:hypothetical protein